MEFKILVTGKNEEVASDLHEHLVTDKGYTVVRCEPTNAAIFDTLLDESPEVVIICLGEETSESIKPFDLLKNGTHKGNCITIVIANEKDEKLFLRYTRLDRCKKQVKSSSFRQFISSTFRQLKTSTFISAI